MRKKPLTHRNRQVHEYGIPMHDNSRCVLTLPMPLRQDDLNIIKSWFAIFEDVLVEAEPGTDYSI